MCSPFNIIRLNSNIASDKIRFEGIRCGVLLSHNKRACALGHATYPPRVQPCRRAPRRPPRLARGPRRDTSGQARALTLNNVDNTKCEPSNPHRFHARRGEIIAARTQDVHLDILPAFHAGSFVNNLDECLNIAPACHVWRGRISLSQALACDL